MATSPLEVTIDKLIHGGQGIGTLADGKKALVWNVLPGETVSFTPRKSRSSYVEGVAEMIVQRSAERIEPRDDLYLSTSPWQMMTYEAENRYKTEILRETLARAGLSYDPSTIGFVAPTDPWHYRNKMEYSFWGDDAGLHLALFNRGTHQKQIVEGSSIARPEIDETAQAICKVLQASSIRAGDLKSLVVRCNRAGETVAALFTRDESFQAVHELEGLCKGIAIIFSNPKSPASVVTKELKRYGDTTLQEVLLGRTFTFDVLSFFQVNSSIYEKVLEKMRATVEKNKIIDMYAGTGSIGLSIAEIAPTLVEIDSASVAMARLNAASGSFPDAKIIHAASEKATEYISGGGDVALIFDPPRAGLHARVVEATLEALPGRILYLSCNPSTLARDLALLEEKYDIKTVEGYNFFPRTPHIEALAVLEKR